MPCGHQRTNNSTAFAHTERDWHLDCESCLQGSFLLFWLVYLCTLVCGITAAYIVAILSPNMDVANAALPTYTVRSSCAVCAVGFCAFLQCLADRVVMAQYALAFAGMQFDCLREIE